MNLQGQNFCRKYSAKKSLTSSSNELCIHNHKSKSAMPAEDFKLFSMLKSKLYLYVLEIEIFGDEASAGRFFNPRKKPVLLTKVTQKNCSQRKDQSSSFNGFISFFRFLLSMNVSCKNDTISDPFRPYFSKESEAIFCGTSGDIRPNVNVYDSKLSFYLQANPLTHFKPADSRLLRPRKAPFH